MKIKTLLYTFLLIRNVGIVKNDSIKSNVFTVAPAMGTLTSDIAKL